MAPRTAPTPAGHRFAAEGRALLASYAAATSASEERSIRGTVRVTAPLASGRRYVGPADVSFLERHPEVRLDLVLADRNLDLVEEGLDMAVRIGVIEDTSLVARRVGEVHRVLVASPAYLARRGTRGRPADLAHHETILASARPGPPEWRFPDEARTRVVRLRPRLTANEVESGLAAARAGCGPLRALSYQVADDLAAGRLVRLLPEFEPPPLPVNLVVPGTRHLPARTRAFLDHAAEALAGAVPPRASDAP